MIIVTKNEFGIDLNLNTLLYSFNSFLLYDAEDCNGRRYFVSYSIAESEEHQLQARYTERYAAFCLVQKMIPMPGGTRCCTVFSALLSVSADVFAITSELNSLRKTIGIENSTISCRLVSEAPKLFQADLLWNRFDIRFGSNVKWCEITCGENRYLVAIHDEGQRLRIGILFVPLGPEIVRVLLAYLFDTFPSAERISYQTAAFSLHESWKAIQEQESICFLLNLDPNPIPVEKRSSRKTRYNLNRSWRMLEKTVGPVEVLVYSADNCPSEILNRYFEMKTARYDLRQDESSAASLFLTSRLPASSVYVLKSTSSVLSVLLCSEQCETVSLVNLGYDASYSRFSPGVLLYLKVLRILEEKRKPFLYLGSGDYPYKRLFHSLPFHYYVGDVLRDAP